MFQNITNTVLVYSHTIIPPQKGLIIIFNTKTLILLNKYYDTLNKDDPDNEDKFFVNYIELFLAQSLIQDFNDDTIKKLGHILSEY